MNEVAVTDDRKGAGGLTHRQELWIEAIEANMTDEQAREHAGYMKTDVGASPGTSMAVQEAMRQRRNHKLRTRLAQKALNAIESLIDGATTPAATKLAAAKWVMEQAGHVTQAEGDKDPPLHQMTPDQLAAFIERTQKVIDAGGSHPVITITPDDGALSKP